MDKYNFDQLKNIKVPENWIKNALNVPNEPPKRPLAPVRIYRFAAGIAACVVIAAAVTISLMFGINKNVDMTDPQPDASSPSEHILDSISPTSAPGVSTPSTTPPLLSAESDQSGTAVTEPNENETEESEAGKTVNSKTKQNNKKRTENKPQAPTKANNEVEKQTEAVTVIPDETEPEATEPADDTKPTRPNDPEVYGCHFLTTVELSEAEGKTYYCKIKDESGDLLGSGTAQKYDWGNPDWPLDLKYTADYTLQYGNNYNVTFYDSNGENVWDGTVYLQQNKSSYLLYNE